MITNILALIWISIIAFGIILYIILDGFDLGIGILSLFFKNQDHKDIMISSILPVWDGNETWLVFGGATLYGAFPLAFSLLLPALYLPIFIMLLGLLFRGVAFEFRLKASKQHVNIWDYCFFAGSFIAICAQGFVLGAFVQGFALVNGKIILTLQEMLNPFNIFCALALLVGYALLGSNRLIAKTDGALQDKFFKASHRLQYFIFLAFIIVSIWTPFLDPYFATRWFNPHNMIYLAILPIITILLCLLHVYALEKRWERTPFWCAIGIFITSYSGFIISNYPYLVPRHITYLAAAAPKDTLIFMLIGAAIMLPVLLYYTYYAYKIFGGKITKKLTY